MTPIVARSSLLALGLLIVVTGVAGADERNLTSLLKTLDLRVYPTPTMAPLFNGATLDGGQLSIGEHRGRVILVNFWATWCVPCRTEMPALQKLHGEFASRGFMVIGVNARESKAVAARYTKPLGLTFPVVVDPDGAINILYGVVGLPTTFLVDRDGRAIALGVGSREWQGATARVLIQALLDESLPAPMGR